MSTDLKTLVYDWNRDARVARADYRAVELDDETLRDGLQSPSVTDPTLDEKVRIRVDGLLTRGDGGRRRSTLSAEPCSSGAGKTAI